MIKNLKSLGLLRNGKVYQTKSQAAQALTQAFPTNDGVAKLARYLDPVVGGEPVIRTLVGFYANANEMEDAGGGQSSYTILDIDGSATDVNELREAIADINAKIGDGIDGTTLTIAINDINARIGSGFTDEYTIADAISQLEEAMTLHLSKNEDEDEFIYTLTQGDTIVGTINIAKDIFIQYAAVVNGYWNGDVFTEDAAGPDKAIKLVFQSELHEPLYINIQDLVTLYVGGNGINISGDTISIAIDGDSEAFLSVSENGLKLEGVQDAIDAAIEAAKLHESDGIKILANNKIKAHAASFVADGINNPIFVDEEGIKLNKELDMGFYDFQTVVNEFPSADEAINTNLVLTNKAAIESLTANTEYNTITIAGGESNNGDIKTIAKNEVTVDNITINGGKGASNGRVLFSTPVMNVSNVDIATGTTAYNVFEGNQNTASTQYYTHEFNANNITVDNTQLNHNVFNIYTPADDAVINIKDGYFNLDVDKSNVLRMANYANATGVTINFENITWTYENAEKGDISWAGLMIFQPSATDVALNGDTSKIATWKVNVKDCVYNGVKVNSNNFGNINQVVYLYNINKTGAVTDAAEVMTIKFE